MIDLSILICSIHTRVDTFFPKMYSSLCSQAVDFPNVEIIACVDNKKRTVGEKRNDLVNMSMGRRVVFADDDDKVEPDYISQIIQADKENPDVDVICFGAKRYVNGVFDREVKYGIQYRKDGEDSQFYYRLPNHLMCFKRGIAVDVQYPQISFGEDAMWAQMAKYKIQTQHTIDKVLYHYYYSPETTETQK